MKHPCSGCNAETDEDELTYSELCDDFFCHECLQVGAPERIVEENSGFGDTLRMDEDH